MTAPIQNFVVQRNTDATITVDVTPNSANDTLVGCHIKFCVYPQQYGIPQDGSTPLITKTDGGGGVTIPPSPPNLMQFDVAFNAADTVNMVYGNYYYEGTVTDEIGNVVEVICGVVNIGVTLN